MKFYFDEYEYQREQTLMEMAERMNLCLGRWWINEYLQLWPLPRWLNNGPDDRPMEPWREHWLEEMAKKSKRPLGHWFINKYLERWTYPDSYMGPTWYDHYMSGFGHSRDSGYMEESNFQVMVSWLEHLSPGESEDTWMVVRESHWVVGWVEWIAIHKNAPSLLNLAAQAKADYESYPLLDEDHYSTLKYEEWDRLIGQEFKDDPRGLSYFLNSEIEDHDTDPDEIDYDHVERCKNTIFVRRVGLALLDLYDDSLWEERDCEETCDRDECDCLEYVNEKTGEVVCCNALEVVFAQPDPNQLELAI